MPRYAIIENGLVANVISAPEGFTLDGVTLIADESVCIGWAYDGKSFSPPADPVVAKETLLSYAAAKRDIVSSGGLSVNVGTVAKPVVARVYTSPAGRSDLLGMLATVGEGTIQFVQSSGVLALNRAQLQTIASAVADLRSNAFATWGAVVADINSAKVTTMAQIDAAAWPLNS